MQTSKILIMMATYNGEKYLREQLDSIINQTITDWELIIRDDNSLDHTVDIVKEYIARDRRIQLIQNDSDFHGAYYNFFGLINAVRVQEKVYDFYMFADQDDIWDRDKLELLQNFYHEVHTQGPTMIYADMRIIDGKGVILIQLLLIWRTKFMVVTLSLTMICFQFSQKLQMMQLN